MPESPVAGDALLTVDHHFGESVIANGLTEGAVTMEVKALGSSGSFGDGRWERR